MWCSSKNAKMKKNSTITLLKHYLLLEQHHGLVLCVCKYFEKKRKFTKTVQKFSNWFSFFFKKFSLSLDNQLTRFMTQWIKIKTKFMLKNSESINVTF